MAQELTSGLGRPLTWRDKLRNYMREQYGEQGAQFAEGLIGVSEEEQQMRSLQRRYGSELPEDAELDRSMRERLTDPSDIGGIDKLLMILSGTGSVAPRLATAASATESGTLLADAQGSYKKGDTLGAGLQTGLALLPAGLGMLGRGASPTTTKGIDDLFPKPQPEVSMAGTPYTMSVPDEPLYFSRQTGRMGGGGGGMDKRIDLPEDLLSSTRTKDEYGFIFKDPNEYPRMQLEAIDQTRGLNLTQTVKDIPQGNYFDESWAAHPTLKSLLNDPKLKTVDDWGLEHGLDEVTAIEEIGKGHFSKYGLTPDDINSIDPESVSQLFDVEDVGRELQLEKFFEEASNKASTLGKHIPGFSDAFDETIYVATFEMNGVPVGVYKPATYEDAIFMYPNTKGLSKLDNLPTTGRTRLDEIETDEMKPYGGELGRLKYQRLIDQRFGGQTDLLNDPNFESLTPSEQLKTLKAQKLVGKEKELSSLEHQLYGKNATRQQEYSTMTPKSLSKLDNEIGKLKAQINALTGK
jgi:hypothetical protein